MLAHLTSNHLWVLHFAVESKFHVLRDIRVYDVLEIFDSAGDRRHA